MFEKYKRSNFYKPHVAFRDFEDIARKAYVNPESLSKYRNYAEDHYMERYLPKANSDKMRLIAVPFEELKRIQKAILRNVTLSYSNTPHAYIRGRSILTAAKMHPYAQSGFKLDIKDFFHSITNKKILESWWWDDFEKLPPKEQELIHFIVTASTRRSHIDNSDLFFGVHLPQGAPSSGLMSNIVGRHIDVSMWKIARRFNLRVTRYSDDILFTSPHKLSRNTLEDALEIAVGAVRNHGFQVNPDKTRILTPGSRMEVLGMILGSEQPRLSRAKRRHVESEVRGITKFGLLSHSLERHRNPDALYQSLKGYLAFAQSIEPEWAERQKALLNLAVKDLYAPN